MTTPDTAARPSPRDKCKIEGCGHALSRHNDLGYCQSPTTPDQQGPCICDGTVQPPLMTLGVTHKGGAYAC